MKIKSLKIVEKGFRFDEKFANSDNLICVIDNQRAKHGGYYRDEFLSNVMSLFNLDGVGARGWQEFFSECTIEALDRVYTTKLVGKIKEKPFRGHKKGYVNDLERSYFSSDNTYESDKSWYVFRHRWFLEEVFYPEIIRDAALYDGNFHCRMYDVVNELLSGELAWSEILYGKQREEKVEKCLKEISPIELWEGKRLYFSRKAGPLDDLEIILCDEEGWVLDYDVATKEDELFYLVEHIAVNTFLQKIDEKLSYPIFIACDFSKISDEKLEKIVSMIKQTSRQAFFILKERDERMVKVCDRIVEIR